MKAIGYNAFKDNNLSAFALPTPVEAGHWVGGHNAGDVVDDLEEGYFYKYLRIWIWQGRCGLQMEERSNSHLRTLLLWHQYKSIEDFYESAPT